MITTKDVNFSVLTHSQIRDKNYALVLPIKNAKNGSMIFEKNQKLHNMQTRNMEHFKVTHCNTERLKKISSPSYADNIKLKHN